MSVWWLALAIGVPLLLLFMLLGAGAVSKHNDDKSEDAAKKALRGESWENKR